jgi:hypothetical protein
VILLLIFLAVALVDFPDAQQFRLLGLRGLVQSAPGEREW